MEVSVSDRLSGRQQGCPSGHSCPCHPPRVPREETGAAQVVDLCREEKTELQEVGSLQLVAPASVEPRRVELRLEVAS